MITVKEPYGITIKKECWKSDEEVYQMFRNMLFKKMNGEDPFKLNHYEEGRYAEEKTAPKEKERIFKYFAKKYPELAEKMELIMEQYFEDRKKNNKKHSLKSRCECGFPFKCKEFPCERLTCNGDMCDNGYVYRMS